VNAHELIELIHSLHRPEHETERLDFYRALQAYLVETGYDWQDHMNDAAEEGLIYSGVYLVWAQDTEAGIHFWDTQGHRYLIPRALTWAKEGQAGG
jgi:hypothetical protein